MKRMFAALALILLASCQMEVGVGTKLNANGSGTFTMAVAADKEFIDGLNGTAPGSGAAGLGGSFAGIEELFSSLQKAGWRVKDTTDAKGDRAFTAACDFVSHTAFTRCLGQLSSQGGDGGVRLQDTGMTFDYATKRGLFKTHAFFAGSVDLTGPVRGQSPQLAAQLQTLASQVFTFEVRAQLPGAPRVVAGASEAKVNGDLVTWTPSVGEKLDFRAESDAYQPVPIAGVAVGAALLLGLGLWALMRRRGKPSPDDTGGFVSREDVVPEHSP